MQIDQEHRAWDFHGLGFKCYFCQLVSCVIGPGIYHLLTFLSQMSKQLSWALPTFPMIQLRLGEILNISTAHVFPGLVLSGQRLGQRVSPTVELEKQFGQLMEGRFVFLKGLMFGKARGHRTGEKGPLILSLRLMLSQARGAFRQREFPSFSLRHCAVRISHASAICGS